MRGQRFSVAGFLALLAVTACTEPAPVVPQLAAAPEANPPRILKLTFSLPNMDREMCETFPRVILGALEGLSGVLDAGFAYEGHVVTVYYNANAVTRDRLLTHEAFAWIGVTFLDEEVVTDRPADEIFKAREANNDLVMPPAHMADMPHSSRGYRDAPPGEFKQLIEDPAAFVLDVHIPEQAHIEGTDAFIPFDEIQKNLDRLPQDKGRPIAVYCRSGRMSADAAKELAAMGYTNVTNLVGGVKAWTEAGYAVADSSLLCCGECRTAFSQSPVGVGPEGASCGQFPTARPLSDLCGRFFAGHPQSVAACG